MRRSAFETMFQSAPRSFPRGDVEGKGRRAGRYKVSIRAPEFPPGRCASRQNTAPTGRFQSAPRSFPRGDLWPAQSSRSYDKFQSAPRSFPRGDYDPAKRQDRKALCHDFRERRHSPRGSSVSNVKDRQQTLAPTASRGNRETTGVRPALGVRGSTVTRSEARSNRPVWPSRGVLSAARQRHRESKTAASLLPRRLP